MTCWQNTYYSFSKPVGTSLVCIQGDWSNVVDAGIKGGLATLATMGVRESNYTPLYARAPETPRPWGVTALFAEDTGVHVPLDIDWSAERRPDRLAPAQVSNRDVGRARRSIGDTRGCAGHREPRTRARPVEAAPAFATFWDLARAVNRSDPAALALARNDATDSVSIDAGEIRKLLGTMWFRDVVPRLSEQWQRRVLDVLVDSMAIPNHVLRVDHRDVRLSELTFAQLSDVVGRISVPEGARSDIDLLIGVGRLWGGDAMGRFQFVPVQDGQRSRLVGLLQGLRSS